MSKDVSVRMKIPFAAQAGFSDPIEFDRWLPIAEHDRIVVEDEEFNLTLKFDPECSAFSEQCTDRNLPVNSTSQWLSWN